MTMTIVLTKGQVALVDEADYEAIVRFKWYADWHKHIHGFYACRKYRVDAARETSISMHRFLLGPPVGFVVDHINHDGLDNRRCNLRICTHRENSTYRLLDRDSHAELKGVYFHRSHKKWCAHIKVSGHTVHLGHFPTAELAARAYDAAAIERFGSFALTNEMLGLIPRLE